MKIEYLQNEICRVGRSLFERGYAHATAGNISHRVPLELGGGILITPTDACLGFLEPEKLAWVGDDDIQISGERASKTLTLHRTIYQADQDANCVIHTHSTHLVALTLQLRPSESDLLPPITPYFVMKVGHVPRIGYHRPGDPMVAELVARQIGQAKIRGLSIHAVMLDRLGPNVWHETAAQAMALLEELEETARLLLMCHQTPSPLNSRQIEELRQQFKAPW